MPSAQIQHFSSKKLDQEVNYASVYGLPRMLRRIYDVLILNKTRSTPTPVLFILGATTLHLRFVWPWVISVRRFGLSLHDISVDYPFRGNVPHDIIVSTNFFGKIDNLSVNPFPRSTWSIHLRTNNPKKYSLMFFKNKSKC